MTSFYTLLFIDQERIAQIHNGVTGGFENQIQTLIKCCENLNHSLRKYDPDANLTVLTNNSAEIAKIAPALCAREIPFPLVIPRGIPFYSAHHKIDVYRWLADNADPYAVVIDSDVVCINEMPHNLRYCIDNAIPTFYDVTSQIYPAHTRERIIADKNLLAPSLGVGNWIGGEFLGGGQSFFLKLSAEIENILGKYFEVYPQLHHQSDETLTSVALERMAQRGEYMVDVGTFGGLGRYWSRRTLHCQKLLESYKDHYLLHLPADKSFLATFNHQSRFIDAYSEYLRGLGVNVAPIIYAYPKRSLVVRIRDKIKSILRA